MNTLPSRTIGSATLTSYSVFHGWVHSAWPLLGLSAATELARKSATPRSAPRPKGTGVEYPDSEAPDFQTTFPVALSRAVPAPPTLKMTRLPSTRADPANPQVGT